MQKIEIEHFLYRMYTTTTPPTTLEIEKKQKFENNVVVGSTLLLKILFQMDFGKQEIVDLSQGVSNLIITDKTKNYRL